MCSVFKQQASSPYDVVVPVVPAEAVVPVVPAPVAVKMPSRLEQECREPEKTRIYSQESLVVRQLNSPGQLASSTAMKTRLLASASEQSGPKVNARPSKAVVFTGAERTTPARVADPFVIRLFPVTGKSRLATTAGGRRKKQADTTCRRCAYRERRAKPTTSTGTDTETDQAELTREDSRVCTCEAGPVDKQVAASGLFAEPPVRKPERAAVESPVNRADRGGAARAALDKVAQACGRRQLVEEAVFCHRDRMLTAMVGGGLMLGSLLIALLLLLVVGYRDKNAASAATTMEAKISAPTEADLQPPLGKAYAQIHPSQNDKMDRKRRQQHSNNHTDHEPSTFLPSSRPEYGGETPIL